MTRLEDLGSQDRAWVVFRIDPRNTARRRVCVPETRLEAEEVNATKRPSALTAASRQLLLAGWPSTPILAQTVTACAAARTGATARAALNKLQIVIRFGMEGLSDSVVTERS